MYEHTDGWEIDKPTISDITGKIYTINGHSYCRVTKTLSVIAKVGLYAWYARVGQRKAGEVMKNRQVFGTKMHSMFEHMLLGDFIKPEKWEHKEAEEDNLLFKLFTHNCSIKAESLEQRLWSDEYGYAGTVDLICKYTSHNPYCVRGHEREFKDDLVIVDYKTSRDIYDDYFLQLAAYTHAFYERTGVKVKGCAIVQFRNGKIRIKERTWEELEELFKVYAATLILYKWKNHI